MRLYSLVSLLLLGTLPALAAPVDKSKPSRQQKAHVHGAVKLGIAVDGSQAELDLDAPAEAIFGFEHAAKTPAHKSTVAKALAQLRTEPTSLFGFAESANCTLTKAEVTATQEKAGHSHASSDSHHDEHEHDSKATKVRPSQPAAAHDDHADVEGRWTFLCKTPLAGSKLSLQLFKHFPRIQRLELTLVSGSRQTGKTLTKDEALDL